MSGGKRNRPPQTDICVKLFWVSTAANAAYIALLLWAIFTDLEVLSAVMWTTIAALLAHGLTTFAAALTRADIARIRRKAKAVAKKVYAFIKKELATSLPVPSDEDILSVVEEFITALVNSPVSKLPFFQRLYYETEPIEGSDVCFLHPVTRWGVDIYNGVRMYRLSLLRLSPERLPDNMVIETLRVLRRLIQRHLEDGTLSLGPFPITYDGTYPSLYLFTMKQDSDYVHLEFMWATPENIATIIEQHNCSHPNSDGNNDDQDF